MWITVVLIGFVVLVTAGLIMKKSAPKLGKLLLVLTAAGVLVVGMGTAVCWSQPQTAEGDYDYAILLGALLEEGKPTPELERRMTVAMQWLQTDEETVLFVSGGVPKGQGISEAQVMYNWLADKGADVSRVIMEDQAADTRQNILFSKRLAEEMGLETDTVLLITSEYHQTRAGFLAKQLGQQPRHLSCATPFVRHLDASFREVFAFVKAFAVSL